MTLSRQAGDEFAQQVIVTKRQGYSTVEVRGASEW